VSVVDSTTSRGGASGDDVEADTRSMALTTETDEEATPDSIPFVEELRGDARKLPIDDSCADLIATSPPYWRKRDYRIEGQIGQESTAAEYTTALLDCLREWRRVLRPTGSVFLNIGDTFHRKTLAGIPGRVEAAAVDDGWIVRNRIIWAKDGGMPDPAHNRLANRHEYIIHLVIRHEYYYDLFGYSRAIGNGANPGDVWRFNPGRHMGDHLAPFPTEIVRRAILLACPLSVCSACGAPRRREIRRTARLDPNRPQARRAMELARQAGLTKAHIATIQATGVSDAGKALRVQNGTGRNAPKSSAWQQKPRTCSGATSASSPSHGEKRRAGRSVAVKRSTPRASYSIHSWVQAPLCVPRLKCDVVPSESI
jgi:SAM-dependent methyltransferase